ncbi:MAG TPA: response regulator transcription factor [Actinoplanes sp.]|jgi:DNA-binding NarL/FixJ family response regulator
MVPLQPFTVVICDDHPLIRAGMASAVASEPGLVVAEQVADPAAATAALAEHPDAVLIIRDTLLQDAALPPVGLVIGIDAMSGNWLRLPTRGHVRALIRRSGPPDDVRRAALAVARGNGFIAADLALPVLHLVGHGGIAEAGDPSPAMEGLTAREREVLRLLSRGDANREIAVRLHITEKTVKFHVSNLLIKTGLRSRGQLIAWAVRTADFSGREQRPSG